MQTSIERRNSENAINIRLGNVPIRQLRELVNWGNTKGFQVEPVTPWAFQNDEHQNQPQASLATVNGTSQITTSHEPETASSSEQAQTLEPVTSARPSVANAPAENGGDPRISEVASPLEEADVATVPVGATPVVEERAETVPMVPDAAQNPRREGVPALAAPVAAAPVAVAPIATTQVVAEPVAVATRDNSTTVQASEALPAAPTLCNTTPPGSTIDAKPIAGQQADALPALAVSVSTKITEVKNASDTPAPNSPNAAAASKDASVTSFPSIDASAPSKKKLNGPIPPKPTPIKPSSTPVDMGVDLSNLGSARHSIPAPSRTPDESVDLDEYVRQLEQLVIELNLELATLSADKASVADQPNSWLFQRMLSLSLQNMSLKSELRQSNSLHASPQ